jgi:thiamine biosynthesis lipoprotein
MGTEFKILLYTTTEADARRASAAAFERVARLNAILSDYDPESELMRLCAQAGGEPVPVSEDLYRVLERAVEVARATGGAFDPTMGPVVRLWRRARRQRRLPDERDLAEARRLVDWKLVELDPEQRTVRLGRAGMRLDLGGIAKGYAAAEALKVLEAQGIRRALVAAAGDIALGEPPPEASGWRIAVATPDAESGVGPTLVLSGCSVSTSGDAEQFVEIGGVRYSHIVDPRTGIGVQGRSSATVVGDEGARVDAVATALSVLGPEEGIRVADQLGLAARVVVVEDSGRAQVRTSRLWETISEGDAARADER